MKKFVYICFYSLLSLIPLNCTKLLVFTFYIFYLQNDSLWVYLDLLRWLHFALKELPLASVESQWVLVFIFKLSSMNFKDIV